MRSNSTPPPKPPIFSVEARQTVLLLTSLIGLIGLVVLMATVAVWLVPIAAVLVLVTGVIMIVDAS